MTPTNNQLENAENYVVELREQLEAMKSQLAVANDPKSVGGTAWLAEQYRQRAEKAEAERDAAHLELVKVWEHYESHYKEMQENIEQLERELADAKLALLGAEGARVEWQGAAETNHERIQQLERELADERARREAAEGIVTINGEKYRAV